MSEVRLPNRGYRFKSNYKNEALTAAMDLFYGEEVMERIKNAKSDSEICRIMITARRNLEKEGK